jgi:hypothetical protein
MTTATRVVTSRRSRDAEMRGEAIIGAAKSNTNRDQEMFMNIFRAGILMGLLMLTCAAAAQSPGPTRVRGTITAIDGNVLSVKSREGQDLKIEIAPNATFAYMKKMELADIKPGTPLGATAVEMDGKLVARELHLFTPGRPIPNEGHRPWDLEPNATMTNAAVSEVTQVQSSQGNELTLKYAGGEKKVLVPAGIPIVMAVDADRSVVLPGQYAYIAVTPGPDGKLTATRLQMTKDGVRPPQ